MSGWREMDAMDGSKESKAPANGLSRNLPQLTLARLSRLCQECLCTWAWGGLLVAGRGGAVFMRWSFGQLSLIWDLQVTLCPHTRPLTLWGLWSETEGLLLMNRQPATGHAQSIMALLHYVSKYTSAPSSVNSALTNCEGQGLPAALRRMKMFHIKLCFSQIISLEFHYKSASIVFFFSGNDVGGDFGGRWSGCLGWSDVWTASTQMSTAGLIFLKRFPLSPSINTLIAQGIAKHKMNVKGWRNNKKGKEERACGCLGQKFNRPVIQNYQEHYRMARIHMCIIHF